MPPSLRAIVLPASQRRTLSELKEELDLDVGDRRAKQSGFWAMLLLSAVIAAAGVLSDSTATVIGAMIIAPLATPIINVALGIILRDLRSALITTTLGTVAVIAVGVLASLVVVEPFDPATNSQIASRVSPDTFALAAAIATGLAGAIARARRDLSGVLPGVAIAISLVPPLAVVGICLGAGAFTYALGALLLYLSNLVALVLTGTLLFAVLGYGTGPQTAEVGSTRRARVILAMVAVAVLLPIVGNTVATRHAHEWQGDVAATTEEWLRGTPDAAVTNVVVTLGSVEIAVTAPGELPPTADLLEALEGDVPGGYEVTVRHTLGSLTEVGTVGGS